ncbi:MAG TPA: YraN family protein [Saprospiraceae bacterium]|nr:YraN family protein [Saprospiraceae bacterium]
MKNKSKESEFSKTAKQMIGIQGEQWAAEFLENKGYQILEKNWRYSKAEIDLIAKKNEILVFVEVKTRTYDFFGSPEEFVSLKKQNLIAEAASVYMEQIGHQWEIRFDVIGILAKTGKPIRIEHFEDAWFD